MQILKKTLKAVSLSDIHFGHEDVRSLKTALDFVNQEHPDLIVLNGDILDCYDASSFLKNPELVGGFQSEIKKCKSLLKIMRNNHPTAKMVFIEGNHEDRIKKMLWSSPVLAKIFPGQDLNKLLELSSLDISHVSYGDALKINNFTFTHGHKVSAKAPNDYMVSYGTSGTSGHTHKLSATFKRVGGKTLHWIESGCLCDLKPEYIKGNADWHHGFGFGFTDVRGSIQMRPMRIIGNEVF